LNDDRRKEEALFRYGVLGDLLSRELRRGELKHGLAERASKIWIGPGGRERRVAAKTLQEWYYRFKRVGLDGLLPRQRRDAGELRALPAELQELIVAMKREDPGRSAALILRELIACGRVRRREVSEATIRRLLRREGLNGPRLELDRPARYRWQATTCGELWQGDALHGPRLFDPAAGKDVRVKIFALMDDRSRLVVYLRGGFHETQQDFLTVLLGAVLRRGVPRSILLDNHGSFSGSDVNVACAKLSTRLLFTRPYDGPAKGKIERFWRTLRAHVLDRLNMKEVESLDDLNLRLWSWVEGEYNTRPHSGLSGRSPLEVWEEDADEIRWVDDPAAVEKAFSDKLERQVRNDSTCQLRGRTFEVPTSLRRRRIEIHFSLLHPDRFWVEDGQTRIPIREVEPETNSRRARAEKRPPLEKKKPSVTGLNPVEDLLRRLSGKKDPKSRKEKNHDE
jgi:transposase InsO family protein